ncbi:unnamed protein product [Haemonchus placei]|uniref:Secreted protein n=1 Tax=Haemonchus placei TaxID=6290 RepID=A0A0N4WRI7_HAEPC|nr:unnamed protein product [Haemonchus placei]
MVGFSSGSADWMSCFPSVAAGRSFSFSSAAGDWVFVLSSAFVDAITFPRACLQTNTCRRPPSLQCTEYRFEKLVSDELSSESFQSSNARKQSNRPVIMEKSCVAGFVVCQSLQCLAKSR